MPEFMNSRGMPIKALAWTGEEAPEELSADGLINTAGYSWNPKTDRMKIMMPKIFYGQKKKGRFTKETVFFEDEVTLENITKFYENKKITHATILSKTASLYDPIGFAAPLNPISHRGGGRILPMARKFRNSLNSANFGALALLDFSPFVITKL